MNLEKFYFTYGSDDDQPYCGGSYQNQQPQQMGFSTRSQRQQWQGAEAAPEAVQPSYSQGNPDDFSEIDDTDDLPF